MPQSHHTQIEAGVDAIQIFDSWGSAAPGCDYELLHSSGSVESFRTGGRVQ